MSSIIDKDLLGRENHIKKQKPEFQNETDMCWGVIQLLAIFRLCHCY